MKNLQNRKILLIICGGIAAYKSLELIRILKKLLFLRIWVDDGVASSTSWTRTYMDTGKYPMKVVGWPLADDSESVGVGTGRKQRRQWNWWGDHWQGGSENWWLSTGKSLGNWWGEYYQSRFTDHPDSQSTPTKDHHQHPRIPQNWYFHTTHKQQNIKNNWNPL